VDILMILNATGGKLEQDLASATPAVLRIDESIQAEDNLTYSDS
jgi:hypothetical protein